MLAIEATAQIVTTISAVRSQDRQAAPVGPVRVPGPGTGPHARTG